MRKILIIIITIISFYFTKAQQTLTVKVDKPQAIIQPTMWGVFFEDINFGADGGLYAEMVKNRSFEFFVPLMGWQVTQKVFKEDNILILNGAKENPHNPHYLRVSVSPENNGGLSLINEGFRGMGIKKGLRYDFSLEYRQVTSGLKLHIQLLDNANKVIGQTIVIPDETGYSWHKATTSIIASATVFKGQMKIWFEGTGVIDLDMVSLFPSDTWKGRSGGLRADMVQKLADLKPGFVRFPGGCIVEGFNLAGRYEWKKTIGATDQREYKINRWNFEFPHKAAPDYFQSFGLGFFEYFQLAEDIGAEPLPILNCGMACQFNSSELTLMKDESPYVEDALDLIEFANGDTTTTWGKMRAHLGHPNPFHLKIMGVGNENWGPQYVERLKLFMNAIKSKYPDFKIVCSSGTDPDGDRFNYLNDTLRALHASLIDEHYYRSPEWFFANAQRYDGYPGNDSRVFVGEYAAHVNGDVKGEKRNCWLSALSEAAFMTGLERNAGKVSMASYAPLFAHIDAWQWAPDLIWVNNLQAYGTPDYYVQQMYSLNKGNKVLPITLNNNVVAGKDSLYATACLDTVSNEVIVKIVNASRNVCAQSIVLEGVSKISNQAKITVMQSNDLYATNSFDTPLNVSPKESVINIKGKKIPVVAAPYSFSVVRVKIL